MYSILQKANQLFNVQHYHCSQAVFAAFAETLGISEKQALKIAGCFGCGMNKGEVCGCVTVVLEIEINSSPAETMRFDL